MSTLGLVGSDRALQWPSGLCLLKKKKKLHPAHFPHPTLNPLKISIAIHKKPTNQIKRQSCTTVCMHQICEVDVKTNQTIYIFKKKTAYLDILHFVISVIIQSCQVGATTEVDQCLKYCCLLDLTVDIKIYIYFYTVEGQI